MQPTCDRCGRPRSAEPARPGAPAPLTCACEPTLVAADAPGKGAREPRSSMPADAGNVEVDPWSVPPPENGYESLDIELDPTGPQQPGPAAVIATEAAPDDADDDGAGHDIASSIEARADAEPAAPRTSPLSRTQVVAAGAGAAALVLGISGWLLLRGDRGTPASASGVHVTVTQEVPWNSPPPLAPIDPSYVERARPSQSDPPSATRPALHRAQPSPGGHALAASAVARTSSSEPTSAPTPTPTPTGSTSASTPTPVVPSSDGGTEAGAAAATGAAISVPIPPPPVVAASPAAPADAAAQPATASARPPVLQTRTCVEDALRVPRGLEGGLPAEVVLHVQVGEDGRPVDVAFPGRIDPRLRSALLSAVRTCRFTPGADGSGRPAVTATTMRLRFEP